MSVASDRTTVVLVNEEGDVLGVEEKLAAHEAPGHLHLAFSVVLYREDGKMLLQQRASSKYHFPMMWANACCSHPGLGEDIRESATHRVEEELGVQCELREVGSFIYKATCDASGRVEHELDHVFVGTIAEEPVINKEEVETLQWVSDEELVALEKTGATVPWLRPAIDLTRS